MPQQPPPPLQQFNFAQQIPPEYYEGFSVDSPSFMPHEVPPVNSGKKFPYAVCISKKRDFVFYSSVFIWQYLSYSSRIPPYSEPYNQYPPPYAYFAPQLRFNLDAQEYVPHPQYVAPVCVGFFYIRFRCLGFVLDLVLVFVFVFAFGFVWCW
jgi:hypothetical protein